MYCYAGPECRLHGSQAASAAFDKRIQVLQSDLIKTPLERLLPDRTLVRRGLNGPDSTDKVMALTKEGHDWRSKLTEDEIEEIENYRNTGFDYINEYLNFPSTKQGLSNEGIDSRISEIDSALAKATPPVEPRLLYRSFKVPGLGKKVKDAKAVAKYIDENFTPGTKLKWNAFLSTSLDSDLMVYHTSRRENLVIFEIISARGAIVHTENSRPGWSAKDEEKEVLIPRGSTMRVANVLKNVSYETTHAEGVTSPENPFAAYMKPKPRRRFTVVQLVDES